MKKVTVTLISLGLFSILEFSLALDNGLGLKPILGWTTGERYSCLIDCEHYPDDCISEYLIKMVADLLSLTSFQSAGYQYVVIGDCWMDEQRDEKGRLRGDRRRFPSGMADLATYIHRKNLKIGLHLNLGVTTCAGYPGSQGRYQLDVQTVSDWGIDMVTVDACGFSDSQSINNAYVDFGRELNRTNRPILYACNWPMALRRIGGGFQNFSLVSQTCNSFLVSQPTLSFETLTKAVQDYNGYSFNYKGFVKKGSFTDLDQMVVGGFSLSEDQERFQMGFWTITSSPLLLSIDLPNVNSKSKKLLLHKELLSINQDALAAMATEKLNSDQISVWTKPITPAGSYAVGFFSMSISGLPSQTSVQLSNIGISGSPRYNVTELFTGFHYGVFKPWHYFNCEVEPTGALVFKFIAI